MQYDYSRAYLDFIRGFPIFVEAKRICLEYLLYPEIEWRNLFINLINQICEFEETLPHDDDI